MDKQKLREAASLMGRKGGPVMTEKKLQALRKNIEKAWGKRKGKTYPMKKKVIPKPPLPDDEKALSAVASLMGKVGGAVKSAKKARAARLNARGGPDGTGKKAGRNPEYHFEQKTSAILGPRARRPCMIPDEVANDLDAFRDGKNFPVHYTTTGGKTTRGNASIYSLDDGEILVIQSFTKKKINTGQEQQKYPGRARRRQAPATGEKPLNNKKEAV